MKKLLGIALLLALTTTGVAFAHGPDGHHGHGRGEGRGRHFAELDADENGSVSLEEMRAGAQRHFERMDADKNGQVTRDEMKGAMRARFEGHRGKRCDHDDEGADPAKREGKPTKAAPKSKG